MGGNQGDVKQTLLNAFIQIKGWEGVQEARLSRFYRTTPVDCVTEDLFVNAVCGLQTTLLPLLLFEKIEQLERALGKTPKCKREARPIDLDLLWYEGVEQTSEKLTLPHPRLNERLFVLKPLSDLVPELVPIVERHPNPHRESVYEISEDSKMENRPQATPHDYVRALCDRIGSAYDESGRRLEKAVFAIPYPVNL